MTPTMPWHPSISSLEAQIEDLTSQITDAKNEEQSSAGKVNTYEQLLQAYVAYTDGDIEKAGTALGNVNTDYLSDDSMTVYDTINAQVNAEYIRKQQMLTMRRSLHRQSRITSR